MHCVESCVNEILYKTSFRFSGFSELFLGLKYFFGSTMDKGIERDHTSGGGGLPTLPGLNLSTIQPSRRGFYRIHVCEGEDNWRQYI